MSWDISGMLRLSQTCGQPRLLHSGRTGLPGIVPAGNTCWISPGPIQHETRHRWPSCRHEICPSGCTHLLSWVLSDFPWTVRMSLAQCSLVSRDQASVALKTALVVPGYAPCPGHAQLITACLSHVRPGHSPPWAGWSWRQASACALSPRCRPFLMSKIPSLGQGLLPRLRPRHLTASPTSRASVLHGLWV